MSIPAATWLMMWVINSLLMCLPHCHRSLRNYPKSVQTKSCFKEGMEKLNENQHQLQTQSTITADLVSGLWNEVAQVKHNITEEVSTAKQYTHNLFNNLKLELNPCIDYLTDRQAKFEHHLQHDQQMPSEPFASTNHTSKLPQPSNAMGMPSDIPTPHFT